MPYSFKKSRENMIESQIRPNKVTDPRLIEALHRIPREVFVPADKQGVAYVDNAIELGQGRYLMEPVVLARLIQAAGIEKDDVVLNIGCATGYSSALLGCLASTVVALEEDKTLAAGADKTLFALGIHNAVVVQGALCDGYAKQEPYDAILINGAVDDVPEGVLAQLSEGGRLVTVLRDAQGTTGSAILVRRIGDTVSKIVLFDAIAPVLPGFEKKAEFSF